MKDKIKIFLKEQNIEYAGITTYDGKYFIVCLFPYFAQNAPGNISLYARGLDYHTVVIDYLEKLCKFLNKETNGQFTGKCYCDISPYSDRSLAIGAGLGFIGKNGCVINEKYGSYVFIGYIETDFALEPDFEIKKTCLGCNKCIIACPGGAICDDSFKKERCASYLSQKKGELTNEEQQIIIKSNKIWGCDICQSVCPHNADIPITPIKEFKDDLINYVNISDLEGLSNKSFKEKFKNRAFIWRGKEILIRNCKLF